MKERPRSHKAVPTTTRRWTHPLFSALCLAWLLLRSGRRPSRLRYPCQQAAAAHSTWAMAAAAGSHYHQGVQALIRLMDEGGTSLYRSEADLPGARPDGNVFYPKFVTGRGTCVSLRNGIWTGSGYDKSRFKLINVPVLKSHNAAGVTASLKNFMGVPSIHATSDVHRDLIYGGFMGRMMNEVIYPDLNIVDAIWVSPSHPDGPAGPYSRAVRLNILLAGTDPVALDWYAGKHVLYPVSGYGRHDPGTPFSEGTNPYHDGTRNTGYAYNAFRIMLDSTASVLRQGGRDVTSDPARCRGRIFVFRLSPRQVFLPSTLCNRKTKIRPHLRVT